MDNRKNKERKSCFRLGDFIKEKILGMYGIKKNNNITSKEKDADPNKKISSDLLPHDTNKL